MARLVSALKRRKTDGMEKNDGRDQAADCGGGLFCSEEPPAGEKKDEGDQAGSLKDAAD
jgi:hypothetical protein